MLGTRTLGVTYPLLAFAVTKSPAWTGWVVFASTVPGLLCYLPAGTLIDRLGPGRVMACSEAARGLLMGALTAALICDVPEIRGLLLAIAFVEGGLAVLSSVAETALIPAATRRDDIPTALAAHETTAHAVVLAGRPVGGILFGLGAYMSFFANAVVFMCSAALLWRLNPGQPARTPHREPVLHQIREGIQEVWRNPFLLSATILTAVINLIVQSLIVVFISYQTSSGLGAAAVGGILAASGVGGAAGAFISPKRKKISRKIDGWARRWNWTDRLAELVGLTHRGRSTLLVHAWVCSGAIAVIFMTGFAPSAFALALLMIGVAGGLSNVTIRTLLSRVPADKVARVVSVSRLGSYSTVALGPVLASLLYESAGPRATLGTVTVSMVVVALVMTLVPTFRKSLSPRWPSGRLWKARLASR
ncbi:hypothetical protein Psi02_50920 [Planotetraspora silvatica]|uniref:MFS transporter n=2 Tax=Planotetraspora silvatica TaxID=234614 RepID=A0A8J3UNY3_9ACTN|nr:hypothetical protein Psi02_50920 [Planotetraspora silvatica]